MEAVDVLIFANLLCCGIVTGTYTFEMVVVVTATNTTPTLLSAQIHRALFSHLPNRYMPWLGMTAAFAAAALLAFETDRLSETATLLYAIGLVCWTATFAILGRSRPIDRKIAESVETSFVERDYLQARRRWNSLMFMRGPLGVVAFACFVSAALS